MTTSAKVLNHMMRIDDQIEDLEISIDYVRRTSGSESHIATLQQQMQELIAALEESWNVWNDCILKERLAQV